MKKTTQWKRNSRRKQFIIILLCTGMLFVGACQTKQKEQPLSEKSSVTYQTEYYQIEVPAGWKIENQNDRTLFLNKEMTLSIDASSGNNYCSSALEIIHTYLGMHASVNGELKETEEDGWKKNRSRYYLGTIDRIGRTE